MRDRRRSILTAMERARATWTDERLDDLSRRIDAGFNRVEGDLRELRSEMSTRFDALHTLSIQLTGGMLIAVIATLVSVVVTRV
jgi:hypothetical protein